MCEKCVETGYHFDRSNRLLTSQQYQSVFNKAQKVSDSCFLMLFHKNNQSGPRLGLAVAKKRARLAVQRNLLKRIIRESFRIQQHNLPSVDVVILIRPQAIKQTNADLFKKLEKLWIKLKQKVE